MHKRSPLFHSLLTVATLTALLVIQTSFAASVQLPDSVSDALRNTKVTTNHAAFFVQRVDADQPLIAHNTKMPMKPASTMKLITTYAALELLGPSYSWSTSALTDANPRDGVLNGNLYLKGNGDPSLTVERFWLLLRKLKSRGINNINGDLVLDRSEFRLPAHDPAAFDNEPLRPYNAGPDALLTNFKNFELRLQPDPASRSVSAFLETPAESVRVESRLQYSDGVCGDWREKLAINTSGKTIALSGSYAGSCGEKLLNISPWPANQQVEQLFRALWKELGGNFNGRVRDGDTPASARPLLSHESPPLGEIVRDVNKWSNNVMARQLFLTLSPTRPATPEASRERIESWLRQKGIDGAIVDNGAGLSRSEQISAEGMGRLLLAAWKSPVMPELIASLPIAGVDGTLKKRLGDSTAGGHAHMKTGYIEGVRALAGYVDDRSGHRWVVVGLLNDAQMRNGTTVLDALVRWVAER